MSRVAYEVVLKYCEILDEFIKIRVFSEDDAHRLVMVEDIPGKRGYQQLIINACVLHYSDQVLPRLRKHPNAAQPEMLEEFLYQLCVEVNPHLEIHNVVLPVTSGPDADRNPELHLLDREVEDAATAAAPRKMPLNRMGDLEARLGRLVVGQAEAVRTVARAIRKAAIGLKNPRKPIGTFLFVGQTGVGKTELAKALARCIYDDPMHMIRVDCSEFSQPHEYAKLLGAPPGYVGHNEGGYLSEQMRTLGSGIVLFDEIEKAHPKMHNLLLQIFDEAFVTDAHGQKVLFHDSIVILTSNVGTRELQELQNPIGFSPPDEEAPLPLEKIREESLRALRRKFRPEFINRIDEILVFNPLGHEECVKIVGKRLTEFSRLVRRTGIRVTFHPRVKELMVALGFSRDYGARELHRTVMREVEAPLTERILDGGIERGSRVRVTVKRERINFNVTDA